MVVCSMAVAVFAGGCRWGQGMSPEEHSVGDLHKALRPVSSGEHEPGSPTTPGANQSPSAPADSDADGDQSVASLMDQARALYQAGRGESPGGLDEAKLRRAVEFYSQVIAAEPDLVEAYLGRGQVNLEIAQTWVMEDYHKADPAIQQAFDDFTRATKLDPNNVDAWMGLGQVYMCSGDWSAATEQFDEVLRLDPNNSEAKHCIQECLEQLEQLQG